MHHFVTEINLVLEWMVKILKQRMGHITKWVHRTINAICSILWIVSNKIRFPPVVLRVMKIKSIFVIMLHVDIWAHLGLKPVHIERFLVKLIH